MALVAGPLRALPADGLAILVDPAQQHASDALNELAWMRMVVRIVTHPMPKFWLRHRFLLLP